MLLVFKYIAVIILLASEASILRGSGVTEGLWTGLGKYYSLFWTESMLESDLFQEKGEKFA